MAYKDLDATRRVQKCTIDVINHPKYRSLAGVIMMGETRVEDDPALCPTAYTDGFNKTYGRDFVMSMSEPEMRFVVLHEGMHVALRHLVTWLWMYKEDPMLANVACDFVVNLLLVSSDEGSQFIMMPAAGCLDQKYQGMDSGEVFRELKKNGASVGGGVGFDKHGWEEAKGRSAEATRKLGEEVVKALQQGAVLAGKVHGDMARAVGEITAPKIDWAEQLREFVTSLCTGREMSTWRRPNRRLVDSGVYMPSSYSERIGRIVLGVDTSGSIGGEDINKFLSEVAGVAKAVTPELVDLLYWDTRIAAHEKYGRGQYETLLQSTRPKGGGGTAPSCVLRYLNAQRIRPECVVMLTDGHVGGDWGGGVWPCPVLWVITGNKRTTAATGKTLHI